MVGESYGGMLAIKFAALHPERTATLTIISTPTSITDEIKSAGIGHMERDEALRLLGTPGWSDAATASFRLPCGASPGMLEWYRNETESTHPEVLLEMTHVIDSADVSDYLPRIQCPVLGIYPVEVPTVNEEQISKTKNIKDIRIINIPVKYHVIWLIEPDIIANNISYFISHVAGWTIVT